MTNPISSFGLLLLPMAVMHLTTRFRLVRYSVQFGIIDIFLNPIWWPPPDWVFKLGEFGTFHHVNSVVLEPCTKFGSNISYSHLRSTPVFPQHLFDDVTWINFRFRLLVRWSSSHGRDASSHKIWCIYLYPIRSYWHFFEIQDGGRRHFGFSS